MNHFWPQRGQMAVPSGTTPPHWRQNLGPLCGSPSAIIYQDIA